MVDRPVKTCQITEYFLHCPLKALHCSNGNQYGKVFFTKNKF